MERYLEMKEKIAEAVKANLQDAIALNDDLADHPSFPERNTNRHARLWNC